MMHKICERMIELDFGLLWSCFARVDDMTPELASLMRRAGCFAVYFGVESGDDGLLKLMREGHNAACAERGIRIAQDAGLHVHASLMVGYSGETAATSARTLEFIERGRPSTVNLLQDEARGTDAERAAAAGPVSPHHRQGSPGDGRGLTPPSGAAPAGRGLRISPKGGGDLPEVQRGALLALRAALRRFGHSRYPALHDQVDDLVDQTISDSWRALSGEGAAATSADDAADRLFASEDARRIAFAIFKNRAADVFRASAAAWARQPHGPEALEEAQGAQPDLSERRALMRRMLQVCVSELEKVSREDQDLLASAAGLDDRRSGSLSARERQRLSRLRQRLAGAIRRELGESASRLLREDF
jgi:RNA polymerase sigma-70 factor (ECF subfamily)